MASTSSTPFQSVRKKEYDVFLSFRGTDTRKNFVDHLYKELQKKGIRTFKDDEGLEKGQRIEKLLQIIKESEFAVVVFSKDYASAKWCLEEIATIMECQQHYAEEIVIPIFYDVEPSVVRNQTQSFGESFKRHEEENTEKAKVERWKEALEKAAQISGYHLQNDFNGFEGKCVEKITHNIFTRVNRSTQASSTVVGLETRVGYVGNLLTLEPDDVQFIGIWGMGGIGKTTTARAVFKKFSSQFDGACFLADIRQHKIIELQKTLLETIQKEKMEMEISNEFDGMEKIQRWLGRKKVLIVLDDVDHVEQLQNLAGYCNWFGRGSRVIITTRDAGVLRSHGVDEKHIYEVETLGNEEAIQLFSSFAFKKEAAPGVKELCGLIVRYAMGLPLALRVLGSYLCGLEADEWESTLEQLKKTPNDNILEKLKISFDRLTLTNQKTFLHIACFFRHKKEEYVKDVLKSCDLYPDVAMRVLIEKSLISVVEGRIEMHDLIQDMGWHIARVEKPRSRVWEFEDAVLYRKMELTVTKHIECISLPYNTYGLWLHNYENISSAFEALKILIVKKRSWKDTNFDGDVKDNYELPSSLRWIHFPDYPFRSLPTSFHPSTMDTNPLELVSICLRGSSLENCWITKELNKLTSLDLSYSGSLLETPNFDMMPNLEKLYLSHCEKLIEIHPSFGRLEKLTYLNLSFSPFLLETPNFDMMPNLEKLYLSHCEKLIEIHPSVGGLEKLILLDLCSCGNLKKLPTFIQLSSLEFLQLHGCPLENFPEIQKSIPLLVELNLGSILITQLPSSIRQLCGLTKLCLFSCKDLVSLSDDLCELESLKILVLRDCDQLESLPENLGNLSKLEELHIYDTAIFQLPCSITQLSSLECLCWGHKRWFGERPLKFVPSVSGLCSLKRLQLCDFKSIDKGLPSDLGQCLISLEYLNLQGSNFSYLPESFGQLPHLKYLNIRGCKKLLKLPELSKAIGELFVDSHFAFGKESINIDMLAIKNPMLYSIAVSSCYPYLNSFKGETFLAKKSIQFPFHRKTPFSVSYSTDSSYYRIKEEYYTLLRSFKYRRYGSNRISFNLNHRWYSTQFVGIAVFFVSSPADKWGQHSYQGFGDPSHHHCVINAKLSSHNDIKNEDLQTKCVIVESTFYDGLNYGIYNCFVYLPFSSLWPESKPMMGANDYSRFEVELVDLKASADWGINLLYKCPIGAREHMANCHRSDSGLLTTNDIGCLTLLESEIEYLNHGSNNFVSLPACYSQLPSLQYLDISGREELEELPELPTTIRELYANSNLASESNLVKLATKYPKLYSVSFSPGDKEVSAVELARKFAHHQPFQIMRDSSFIVTYPSDAYSTDSDVTKRFKYSSLGSNKISISLKSSWHNQSFVGFVVRFILNSSCYGIWKSCPDGRPFRYSEVIAQLVHKDNEQLLQTNCVIGRQCDEAFDVFMDRQIICFAYIPFLSLFNNKLRAIPSDYLVFEVAFGNPASNVSADWSCGLLYKNDESLSEALWSKTIARSHDNGDSEESNEEAPLFEETPVSTPEPGEPKFFPYGLMASTSSVTASQSIHEWTYDVFLNFRGSDIDKIFVDYLYTYLDLKGIHTFKDYDQMEKGDCVSLARQKAIKDSRFFITVFSKCYASSKWCLEELATIMEFQEKFKEQIVVPIFYDVEPSDVWKQEGSFGDSFKELVEFAKDEEKEKVRRWKEVLKKAGYLKGHHLQKDYNRLDIKCVQGVAADIFARLNQSNQTWSAFENNLEGLKSRVNDIGNWLRSADDDDDDDARFIGICGMGGIGKTTTAMAVFNKFSLQFDRAYFLPNISRHKIIELQKVLLVAILEVKIGIGDEFSGMAMIRRRLRQKKVLIVLDDVSRVEQLEKLAGSRDWFGRGSRVIITTRDARVLRSHKVDVKYIYKVDTLEEQEAIQLFSWYAFKKKISTTEIEQLCGSIVHHCKGLPLALKLLGSYLCGQEAIYWKSILEKFNDTHTLHTPIDNIVQVLRTSFDELNCKLQKIFLHIACFFRHEMEKDVIDVLKSCDLNPAFGMHVLIERSLISVVEGRRIEMHDLIQDMGWHIAREEKPRSRVWEFEDAVLLLYGKMDPEHIECMVFPYTYICQLDNDENIWGAFKSLKILIGKRSSKEEDNNFDNVMDDYLPSSLRWLHFPDYPFPSLPKSFHSSGMDNNPSQLVGVYLHSSSLENCRITKEFNELTYLNLSSSCSLLETPNFDMLLNLNELYLSGCEKLKEIHPSIGHLQKLYILDLSNCRELEKLPCFVRVLSLQCLRLEYCGALQNFPEIQTTMEYVWELNLQSIWIKELPSSIQKLRGLTKLCFINCGNLVHLSNALCELKLLKFLGLTCCDRLVSLPKNLGNLSKLKELHVIHTAIFQLPSSITQLRSLECLCWGGNRKFMKETTLKFVLISSESGLRSLKRLQLSDFKIPDEGLPSYLGCLISLEYLNLRGSDFVDLPESFSQLPRLQYLDIRDCGKLKELPKLPQSTRELYADFHFASRKSIKELAECPELHSVAFSYDDQYHCPEHCLAKIFIHIPFHTKTPFSVSYPIYLQEGEDRYIEANVLRLFQYRCYQSNGISIDLNFLSYCQSFAGFAVYFLSSGYNTWEPHFYRGIDGVEHCTVIAKLSHKNKFLKRKCVIASSTNGYDNNGGHICFVYIPFSSLWPADSNTHINSVSSNDFSRFEVNFMKLEATADWGCTLLYKREAGSGERDPEVEEGGGSQHTEDSGGDDAMVAKNNNTELIDDEEASMAKNSDIHAALSEDQPASTQPNPIIGEEIQSDHNYDTDNEEDYETTASQQQLGPDRTKLWELTKIVDQVQYQMVSMPECSNAKVSRLLYTNSGVGILRLSSDGIQKLWKWSYNEQNPSRKNWQPNSGPPMINDVSGVNLEEVVPCIALSNDDSFVVSAAGGNVSLFNIMTSEVMKTITSLPSASTFLAFDPHDNNIIAIGTEESSIYIYDWVNEDLIELREHRKPITGLAFSTKLKMLVSADADAQLCVWTTSLWKMRRSIRIQLPDGEVSSRCDTQVMFHAEENHLLVTHEKQLAIYDVSKMELIHQCIPHVSLSTRISSATYSCNSQLIYASFINGNIGVLDADTLRLKCRIVPSAYLPQNRSEVVYPLVIAAHPQEPNQFAVGLTDGSIKVIEPLESQGNWEVSVSSTVDNGKKNSRLVWQVLRGTLATMCLGLFGMGIFRSIQTKTRKSKMNFDGYMADGSRTNRPDEAEKGEPNRP